MISDGLKTNSRPKVAGPVFVNSRMIRRTAFRESGASRHHTALIKDPPKTRQTSWLYCIGELMGAPQFGPHYAGRQRLSAGQGRSRSAALVAVRSMQPWRRLECSPARIPPFVLREATCRPPLNPSVPKENYV